MSLTERVEINPAVLLGKPVIRGTRIPAELIIRKLSEGTTEADLLDAYPDRASLCCRLLSAGNHSIADALMNGSILHFLADENCDFAIVRALRADSHDVLAVSEVAPRSSDRELIDRASQEKRILLTEDKDLGWSLPVTLIRLVWS